MIKNKTHKKNKNKTRKKNKNKIKKTHRFYGSGNTFGRTKPVKPPKPPIEHRINLPNTSIVPPNKPPKPSSLEIEIEKHLENSVNLLEKLINNNTNTVLHMAKNMDLEIDLTIPSDKAKLLKQNLRWIDPTHISARKPEESFLRRIDLIILDKIFKNNLENKKLDLLHLYFEYKLCTYAAYRNNMNILKWAKENGFIFGKEVCEVAIINNEIDILKYAIENGAPCSPKVIEYAVKINPSLINYLLDSGCECNYYVTYFAAKKGDIELLKYFHEKGCPWDTTTCMGAAMGGNLDCLDYAHLNGCPWDETTCEYSAFGGHIECLKYADKNGCPWDETTCEGAAKGGHLECLKYAHQNGCPWNENTCQGAAFEGHIECLIYATENGCPCDADYLISTLKYNLKIMADDKLIDNNIEKAKITKEIIKYLFTNKYKFVKPIEE